MKNAIVMPIVLVVTLLISLLIGTYISITSVHISKEYHRDLAEVRGYWGAYGSKELNKSTNYEYENYDINVTQGVNDYNWSLSSRAKGITNNDIYRRKLTIDDNNSSKIKSYNRGE